MRAPLVVLSVLASSSLANPWSGSEVVEFDHAGWPHMAPRRHVIAQYPWPGDAGRKATVTSDGVTYVGESTR